MMRRLEIAQALVNRPKMLFLDEPSIGLDPHAKRVIWELITRLRDEFGAVVFINTHDMNEADVLCDRLGVMDKGKLVTVGSPAELKASVGGDILTLSSKTPTFLKKVKELGYTTLTQSPDGQLDLLVSDGERLIPHLIDLLKKSGIEVDAVSLKKPTLDDVFLKYTGTRIEASESGAEARRMRRTFLRVNR
jgi:ABC-2 type transport system ATP-binding protein